jgi:hypothetical protein
VWLSGDDFAKVKPEKEQDFAEVEPKGRNGKILLIVFLNLAMLPDVVA